MKFDSQFKGVSMENLRKHRRKLKRDRENRERFGANVSVRIEAIDYEQLRQLSDKSGQSMSDLVRAAVKLLTVVGKPRFFENGP